MIKVPITASISFHLHESNSGLWDIDSTPAGLTIRHTVHCPKCHECACHTMGDFVIPWELVLNQHKAMHVLDTLINAQPDEKES